MHMSECKLCDKVFQCVQDYGDELRAHFSGATTRESQQSGLGDGETVCASYDKKRMKRYESGNSLIY